MRGHTVQKSKMAPSAVETSIATDRHHFKPTLKFAGGVGPYKELSTIGYEKEAEEKGTDGFEPAKVDIILSVPNPMFCNGIRRSCRDI
jgi:hypothetical protein